MSVILLNKPYRVLTRFTDSGGRATLADYVKRPGFYPAGRLDFDSEGLVVLTDDGGLQHQISDPRHKMAKVYWVQVEGVPSDDAIRTLAEGVMLRDGRSAPAQAKRLSPPDVWERNPPIRYRAAIPTTWIEIVLREGRNRQVRRMTAAVGHPTLRLIRRAVGPWSLAELSPGEWCLADPATIAEVARGGGRRHQGRSRRRSRR